MRSIRPATGLRFTWTVEHAHEDRDARQRPVAEAELGGRQRMRDHATPGRRPAPPPAPSTHGVTRGGIAEEQRAPDGEHGADPAERRPEPEQNEARQRKAADERIALGMDRRDLRADGIAIDMGASHGESRPSRSRTAHGLCVRRENLRHLKQVSRKSSSRDAASRSLDPRPAAARGWARRALVADLRQPLARCFGLALPVPHAGVEPALCQRARHGCRARRCGPGRAR